MVACPEPLVCDQVEFHPYLDQAKVREACAASDGAGRLQSGRQGPDQERSNDDADCASVTVRAPHRFACAGWCSKRFARSRALAHRTALKDTWISSISRSVTTRWPPIPGSPAPRAVSPITVLRRNGIEARPPPRARLGRGVHQHRPKRMGFRRYLLGRILRHRRSRICRSWRWCSSTPGRPTVRQRADPIGQCRHRHPRRDRENGRTRTVAFLATTADRLERRQGRRKRRCRRPAAAQAAREPPRPAARRSKEAAVAPRPEQSQSLPQAQTQAHPAPQPSPLPAPSPSSGYVPPAPDLTVKYNVMLGLPEALPPSVLSADADDKKGDGGDGGQGQRRRRHGRRVAQPDQAILEAAGLARADG